MKKNDKMLIQYVLENGNYFEWDTDTKIQVCGKWAEWCTKLSFALGISRAEVIEQQIQGAIEEDEFEYLAMIKDVEVFFHKKNWDHLCK